MGGSTLIDADVRIVAATNHQLKEMILDGSFREDLYYRINVVELRLPPLRRRKEDIIPLSFFFLNRFNQKYHQNKKISPTVLQQLQAYEWPGNIRQLKNTIEMMGVLSTGTYLEAPDFIVEVEGGPLDSDGSQYGEEIKKQIKDNDNMESLLKLEDFTDAVEKEYLLKAYRICKTTRKMAEVLGVNHSTIIRKMKKHGISAKMQP